MPKFEEKSCRISSLPFVMNTALYVTKTLTTPVPLSLWDRPRKCWWGGNQKGSDLQLPWGDATRPVIHRRGRLRLRKVGCWRQDPSACQGGHKLASVCTLYRPMSSFVVSSSGESPRALALARRHLFLMYRPEKIRVPGIPRFCHFSWRDRQAE